MIIENIRMALHSIRVNKMRSIMTIMGVIVGVGSVVTMVSMGEGFKNQVIKQTDQLGGEIITIRPGKLVSRDSLGEIKKVDIASLSGHSDVSTLSDADIITIQKTPGIESAVPMFLQNINISHEHSSLDQVQVYGTTIELPSILKQKIAYGEFFTASDSEKNIVVIGKAIADKLLGEDAPLGKGINIHDQSFIVRGVFEQFPTSIVTNSFDYNHAIFVPVAAIKQLGGGSSQISRILVKPKLGADTKALASLLTERLKINHKSQEDFTVLQAHENIAIANNVIKLATMFISGIGAISLLVGGVGIMNIMLFSVSERTREIGIRKSIGATSIQILLQFLIEATILSVFGSVIALSVSFLVNMLIRVYTHFEPVITTPVVVISMSVATLIGLVFGVMPAAKAARLDPIEALRHE